MSMLWINGRFMDQPVTGVQRYARMITMHLSALRDCTLLHTFPSNLHQNRFNCKKNAVYGHGYFWEQLMLPYRLRQFDSPLLLNLANLGPLAYTNQVVCIHDMATFAHPEWFSFAFARFYQFVLPILARRSRKVITVSNFSKNEIIRYLNVNEDKIEVIPNGMAQVTNISAKRPYPFPYILTIGGFDPRKNTETIIGAFNLTENKDLRLIVVGRNNQIFNKNAQSLPSSERIIVREDADDQEVVDLLAHASLYIQASLYEGFGLPPMEALALGVPVALSDIPVFREVYAGNAFFFTPTSTIELAGIINQAVSGSATEKSIGLSEKYSWPGSARKLNSLLNELS